MTEQMTETETLQDIHRMVSEMHEVLMRVIPEIERAGQVLSTQGLMGLFRGK